jgi:CrcB protein
MTLALGVMALGGIGALLRFVIDNLVARRLGRSLPWGVVAVNVLGSGAAGLIVGATTYQSTSATTSVLILTGLLGGFTTASTISYDVAQLLVARRWLAGLGVALGTTALALLAGLTGLFVGAAGS